METAQKENRVMSTTSTPMPPHAAHNSQALLAILRLALAAANEEGDRRSSNMDWSVRHEALIWAIWVEINKGMGAARAPLAARAQVFWKHIHYHFDDLPAWLSDARPSQGDLR
jgi:uncharacterized NAD(P)/FAD-binding protein YdhS